MTALTRITLGLVSSMLGILMAAKFCGFLPDEERSVIDGRARVAESLAFTATAMIPSENLAELNVVINGITSRQPDLASIGIRSSDSTLLMATSGHEQEWQLQPGKSSTPQYMWVPLAHPNDPDWGRIELCFTPIRGDSVLAVLTSPFMCLLFITGALGFFAFRTFLKLVLKHLDPSQAVPRRVREALDILADGLMIIGLDERILLANTALSEVAGHDPEDMLGRHAESLGFRVSGVPMSLPWKCCAELKSAISAVPMQIETTDGLMSFNVNCSPLMGNEGQHRGVLATFDNITQLEEKKQQLSLARDDAEAANRAKSDFLAIMSHEIRNPMNAIVGFTDILRRGMAANAETQQDYLNTIHASGEHLVGLINDILDLSKIEAGKLELEMQQCRPHQLVAEVVNVMGMRARQQGLELQHEIIGTIPETIESDPTRLRQVLMNLVGNAVKFTQAGGVRIVIDLLESTANRCCSSKSSTLESVCPPNNVARSFRSLCRRIRLSHDVLGAQDSDWLSAGNCPKLSVETSELTVSWARAARLRSRRIRVMCQESSESTRNRRWNHSATLGSLLTWVSPFTSNRLVFWSPTIQQRTGSWSVSCCKTPA